MRGRQVLLETLINHGVDRIFGNPGTTESPLLDSLLDYPQLQYIVHLHEGVATGAANFYALHDDPPNMAETTSQAFLGMSINCAKCHNHPMEKWTNDEYFGFANLFARVRSKTGGGDGEKIIFAASAGNPRCQRP